MVYVRVSRPWHDRDVRATPEPAVLDRRRWLAQAGLGLGAVGLGAVGFAAGGLDGAQLGASLALGATPGEGGPTRAAPPPQTFAPAIGERHQGRFPAPRNAAFGIGERALTAESVAGSHNNYYEFTSSKEDVWREARGYEIKEWKVAVTGKVKQPCTLDLGDLLQRFPLEERLYRFRCVEGWAMQVPWTGYPLRKLIEFLQPASSARYVRFVSALEREKMPGVRLFSSYPWPYVEALRLDEAVHDLAFLAVGIYGHALPMQHGAPCRVVLPWKYGFKSGKSIVAIEFTEERPQTFWHRLQPEEYGFFGQVDPKRAHPRWSQARERDIGTGDQRETLPLNGYADLVGSLYKGGEY